jgi:hypothetical protein
MVLEHSPSPRQEQFTDASVKLYATEAQGLAPKFERLTLAVYQILTNHHIQGSERNQWFEKIMSELNRREAEKQRQTPPNSETPPEPSIYIKDAYAHQLRQPHDTWDPDAVEEARKPLDQEAN